MDSRKTEQPPQPDSETASQRRFDVIIVGAGIAGCATAIALLHQSPELNVLLLERRADAPQTMRIGETLPPQTLALLQQLDLLERFRKRNDRAALGTRSSWGSGSINETPFLYSPYGHGWHIDRASFDHWMIQQARCAGATMLHDTTLNGTPEFDRGWRLTVNRSGCATQSLYGTIVVDASGAGGAFCRSLPVGIERHDKLIAVFRYAREDDATVTQSDQGQGNGNDGFTLVESCAYGWWYSTKLPDQRWITALMTDSDLARQTGLLNIDTWRDALHNTHHTGQRTTHTEPLTALQIKPAHSQCLKHFCGVGWYAVGDAASTFDPLSSSGIYKALRHGLLASYAIRDDLEHKPGATAKYQHVLHTEYTQYLHTHRQYYQLEQRFRQSPFWQRRHHHSFTDE